MVNEGELEIFGTIQWVFNIRGMGLSKIDQKMQLSLQHSEYWMNSQSSRRPRTCNEHPCLYHCKFKELDLICFWWHCGGLHVESISNLGMKLSTYLGWLQLNQVVGWETQLSNAQSPLLSLKILVFRTAFPVHGLWSPLNIAPLDGSRCAASQWHPVAFVAWILVWPKEGFTQCGLCIPSIPPFFRCNFVFYGPHLWLFSGTVYANRG